MIKPSWYISLPPSTFSEGIYNVPDNTENHMSSIEVIETEKTKIILVPVGSYCWIKYITQPNLFFVVSDGDRLQLYNTKFWWRKTLVN